LIKNEQGKGKLNLLQGFPLDEGFPFPIELMLSFPDDNKTE